MRSDAFPAAVHVVVSRGQTESCDRLLGGLVRVPEVQSRRLPTSADVLHRKWPLGLEIGSPLAPTSSLSQVHVVAGRSLTETSDGLPGGLVKSLDAQNKRPRASAVAETTKG